MRGSLTVEASLVMPMVRGIMILALKFGYASYEQVCLLAEKLGEQEQYEAVNEIYKLELISDTEGFAHGY